MRFGSLRYSFDLALEMHFASNESSRACPRMMVVGAMDGDAFVSSAEAASRLRVMVLGLLVADA